MMQIESYQENGNAITGASTIQIMIGPGIYSASGSFIQGKMTIGQLAVSAVYCRSDCFPLATNCQVQVDGKNRLITQCLAADQKCFYNENLYNNNQDKSLALVSQTLTEKQFWKQVGVTIANADSTSYVRYNLQHFLPFLVQDVFEVKNQMLIQLTVYSPTESFLGSIATASNANNIYSELAATDLYFTAYMKQMVNHPPLDNSIISCYEQILQTGTGINISYNTINKKLLSQNFFVKTTGSKKGSDFDISTNYASKVTRNGYQLCIASNDIEQNQLFDGLRKNNYNQLSSFTTIQGEFINSQVQTNATISASSDVGCGFLYLQL